MAREVTRTRGNRAGHTFWRPTAAAALIVAALAGGGALAATLQNSATGTTGGTALDLTNADVSLLLPEADLTVTKSDGVATYTPGGSVTYTIVVSNAGPNDVTGATVTDTFPAEITSANWTCVATGAASCTANGSGDISDTVDLPAGESVTYTVVANIDSAATGNLVNTATVSTAVGDPNPGDESATDTDTPSASADLTVTKSDGVVTYTPGGSVTYTIVVSNSGPSDVTGATVTDTFPAAITSANWTCVATGAASCTANGSGDISDSVDLPAGESVTYTVVANIDSAATGNLVNTATVSTTVGDPNPGDESATDTDTPSASADLTVTKSDGVVTYTPGGSVTYTIVVSNSGPSDVTGATVTDTFPAAITSANWTCVATGAASCTANGSGDISDTVDLPAGESVTYTVVANIDSAATGNLVNTATVSTAVGDPNPGDESATDTDTPSASADLTVTKSDGVATYTPGGSVTYTIVVSNAGPSDVVGVSVTDTFPAEVTSANWTCVATGAASCTANGSGDISNTVDLPSGESVTYTVVANIDSAATGNLVNTATVSTAVGDPNPGDESATDTDTPSASADLTVTKSDGVATYTPGGSVTYTIVVSNAGPSDVVGVSVTDTFPAEVTSANWTCVATGAASCTANGSGDISDTVDLPSGESVTYTVVANIDSAATGNLVNTASVSTAVGDPNPGDESATDTDTPSASADLTVTKSDGVATYTPGGSVTYTIVVSNSGPSDVTGATVTDTFPAEITSANWTCVAAGAASCTANGSGDISDSVDLPAGESVTYTVVASIDSAATGNLVNTASVSTAVNDPNPGDESATDTDTPSASADLTVTKSDGVATYTPGGSVTYTIVVGNSGPSDVVGASVTDTFPAEITSANWTCVATGAASCTANGSGDISDTVDLPAGESVTYTVVANIDSAATGSLVNTAAVSTAINDPIPGDESATDTDTLSASADLTVTKSDGVATYTPGGSVTYTIVVTNAGPSDVVGVSVTDTFPAEVTSANWTCVATGAASCTANGSGDISDTVDLPSGESVTYTVVANIDSAATGNLVNTASVSTAVGDPNPGDESATDTDTPSASADLTVTKSDGVATYTPGGSVTYTIVVSNSGPSDVTGATVTDTFPAEVTSANWTCVATGAASCTANGSGNISDTVDLPSGESVTYTVVANIDPSATANLINTATVSTAVADTNPGDESATDTDTPSASADLTVTKSDGVATYTPGGSVTYTIVVSNSGPSDVVGATVTDTFPAEITSANWTCVATGAASCTANGGGSISDFVDLPAGESVTYTVVADIDPSAAGNLVNTASVSTAVNDPNPGDESETDTDTPSASADLTVTKSDGVATYTPGGSVTYTIVVSNAGPSDVVGASVTDTFPAEITSANWTCVATGAASCTANGSGDISDTVDLPAGESVTYTVVADIDPSAASNLVNTASVSTAVGDPNPGDESATDTDTPSASADLTVTKSDGVATYTPGGSVTYTIVVTNGGPSDVTGASATDTFPAEITSANWSCVATGAASCTANGSGDISDTVDLPSGESVTYTVVATIDSAATGNLVNTGSVSTAVSDPNPGDESATDTDTPSASADLTVTKSDGVATYTPGGSVTYTIVVTNAGPSDVVGAAVTDTFPAEITSANWTCVATGAASCTPNGSGDISDTVDLPTGESVTYTVVADIDPSAASNLVNTASVSTAVGDPNPGDESATDTDTPSASADLTVTKSDGVATYTPGGSVTYTIVVSNSGPSDVTGASVTDTFPAEITSANWTCVATGAASCTANGSGDISDTVDLPAGESVTYTVVANIDSAATGNLVNTASVSTTVSDPNPGDESATDTDTPSASADLTVTKSDGVATYTPGGSVTYTIVVSNAGPSDVTGATVTDTFPAEITSANWTCVATGAASCTANGSGDISDTVDLPAGESVTYTVVANIDSAATGNLVNTATVSTAVGDPNPGDESATDTDTPSASADLTVTKSDGVATYTPGGSVTYTIVVSNSGPSDVTGASVTDTFPAEITSANWTCVATGAASCTANGSGDISDTVDLPAGESVTYTVVATIDSAATGNLVNTATVSTAVGDPNPGDESATDTDTPSASADLTVTKSDGVATYTPGGSVTYTIVVSNSGPSDVTGASVTDTFPAEFTSANWTCVATGAASCTANGSGNISDTIDLPAGESVTYTVVANIDSAATGNLVNTATVSTAVGDPNPGDESATDTDTPSASADLTVTKSDGVATYTPGGSVTYTIVVSNSGPSDVTGATVTDTFPADVASANWTCVATGAASCTANGSGDISDIVDLPAGESVTYTVVADIDPSATGNLINTASVSTAVSDPNPGDESATDTDTPSASADLTVTKSDGVATYTPGGSVTYTIVVSNAGPSDVTGATVTDTFPADVASANWTCVATGAASCTANGSGDISDTVDLPVGELVTYTVVANIDSAATGNLVNTASVSTAVGDPNPGDESATDTDTPSASADLTVTKSDGVATYTPGGSVTYTIVVSNAGPSDVVGASVTDTFPAEITSANWTCVATGAASCTANGSGNISDTVDLPAGESVTYTVVTNIDAAATGNLVNTATVSTAVGDPNPGDESATDTDTPSASADLTVTKSDGVATYTPGGSVTYTVVVSNSGPSNVTGATVTDTFPAEITSANWTCVATGAASCTANGSGNISDTVDLPAGESVTYTVVANIDAAATGNLVNTATVSTAVGDPNPGDESATDTDTPSASADLTVTKSDGVVTYMAGGSVTYTIVVSNAGPSDVVGATVTDTFPAEITSANWTCVATGAASCAANGSGDISDTVDLPAGESVTYTVVANIDAAATGNLVNAASVSTAVSDPNTGDESATDTDTPSASADLTVTKSDGVATYMAGGSVTYTIVVGNAGPSDVVGATVTDTFPVEITSANWTCVATGAASCAANGSGDISDTVDLPAGESVTYTVVANIDPGATGNLVNTASVTTAVPDPNPGDESATDSDASSTSADLTITKSNGVATYTPGGSVTYTIVVSNSGPSNVTGATVTDTFPAEITSANWTCVATGAASCTANGSGDISDTVDLPAGESVTYTVVANIDPSATANLINTASVSTPVGDPNPGDEAETDTDTPSASADLTVTKSDGVASYMAGGSVTYTIVVGNAGPSDVTGASVTDTFPAEITSANWTCVATGAASCTANGSGDISDTVDLPAGESVTYTVVANIDSAATGNLVNTASVSTAVGDPNPGDESATDTDASSTSADLTVTKSDGVASYMAGGSVTYTIVVGNAGPSDVVGATVTDTFPAEITSANWTCIATGAASCTANGSGDISDTVDLPAGESVTYTVVANIDPGATGNLVNAASVTTAVPDPNPGDESATDTDASSTSADLTITKSNGVATYMAGGSVTYTIVVSNAGPSDVVGATVTDTFPAEITSANWTCVATGAASCTANGSGDISDTVDLPAGESVTYTIVANIDPGATGNLVNMASVSTPVGDPNPGDEAETDTDTPSASADLTVTKSDGVATYTPGGSVTYTIVASNAGPSDVVGATVTDTFPSEVTNASWTCVATGAASCTANGSGDISDTVDLPAGESVTYTIVADIDAAATGDLVNTAAIETAVGDPNPGDEAETDTDTLSASADLTVTKSDGVATYAPGGSVTYTIGVSNAGPSDVAGATVTDTFPAEVTNASWTCVATGAASCAANGNGDISDTVDLPAGESLTYTVVVDIDSAATGNLVNTASVSTAVGDPNPGDEAETDTDAPSASADLTVTKSDGVATYAPGGSVTYTIVVSNSGPSDVAGATVTDTFPAEVVAANWTCVATGAASCTANGSGNISDTVDLPAGESVTYTVVADIDPSAAGDLVNTASVATAVSDPNPGDESSTDTDTLSASADLTITKSNGVATYTPGGSVTYTIVVSNAGPSDVTGATVTDTFPGEVVSANWTCVATGAASCSANGSGDISDTVDLPAGESVTYTIVAAIDSGATGNLVNAASVSSPAGDPNPGDESATDTDAPSGSADLSITKSNGVATYTPGGSVTYTIVVSNAGPSDVAGATVTDTFPAEVVSANWTCVATGAAACTANGNGDISDTVDLPAGESVTYTIVAAIDSGATGNLVNAASVSTAVGDPNPGDEAATDTDTPSAAADLSVTKSDGVATYAPGGSVTYTIVVSNAGPSDVAGATVTDTFPAAVTTANWTCVATGAASCTANGSGSISDAVDLPAGDSVTYTVVAGIDSAATGNLVNTVTVSAGLPDPNPGNDSATDVDASAALSDLSLAKTVDVPSPMVGTNVVFTITVSNAGPSNATGVAVIDALPTGYSYVSDDSGGSYVPGTGLWTIGALPAGSSVALQLTATVLSSGNYTNSAEVFAADQVDPDDTFNNGSGTDFDSAGTTPVGVVDLSLTKSVGDPTPGIGSNVVFTVVVANAAAASDATNVTVADLLPSGYSYVADDAGGAYNSATGLWTVGSIPSGSSATLNVTATVLPAGNYVNVAEVASADQTDVDDTFGDGSGSDFDSAATAPVATVDLSLAKSVDQATPAFGDLVTFTLTLTNAAGYSDATGVTVSDPLPSGYSYVSDDSGGAFDSVTGVWTVGTLAAGSSTTLSIVAQVELGGSYANRAEVASATETDADSAPGNGAAQLDEDDEASATTTPVGELVLLSKRAAKRDAVIGAAIPYVLTATNAGSAAVSGLTLSDQVPAGFKLVADTARIARAGDDGVLGTEDDVVEPIAAHGPRPVEFGPFDLAGDETVEISYVLRAGSGVRLGPHTNRATPQLGVTAVGQTASATIEIVADPLFDESTLVGKVFEDRNLDGWQDPDEPGVPGAMVALDDGTYALTDEYGRFHFPIVTAGHRLLKLNLGSLAPGATLTTEPTPVAWVSPGLIARVNFGVVPGQETESVGDPGVPGLALTSAERRLPVEVRGNVETMALLINDAQLALASGEIRLGQDSLAESVELVGASLPRPIEFALEADRPSEIESWTLTVQDGRGDAFWSRDGSGAPPAGVTWDGGGSGGRALEAGAIYQYRFEARYADGATMRSPQKLFGVNRTTAVSIALRGEAFETGKEVLSSKARRVLDEVAEILKRYPDESVVIEGHTDAVGSSEFNIGLSQRRAEAAARYLVETRGLSADRFTVRWFGEERPIGSNDLPEGRTLNRRVELKSEAERSEPVAIHDRHREAPRATINGTPVEVDRHGRFRASLPGDATEVAVDLGSAEGRAATKTVALPDFEILAPAGRFRLPLGESRQGCQALDGSTVRCRLAGRTAAGNVVELDGRALPTAADGSFAGDLDLRLGDNVRSLVVRDPGGPARTANLSVSVTDRDEHGELLLVTEGPPNLTVQLPPRDVRLTAGTLVLPGQTDPGNRVAVNGQPVAIDADGRFVASVALPPGPGRLVVQADSPDGRVASIEREVDVAAHELFMLAFADAKVGQMSGDGFIEAAGLDEESDYYTEGRVAFYLKGRISGKYLITAAFDSGLGELGELFENLSGDATRRLLTNLDPDKYYPVYGDSSTVVYDVQSDGKLYLALDSEEIGAVIGNFPLSLSDTELAAYHRTLYGGKFQYRSLAQSSYGAPQTEATVFGSEVRRTHVHDELRATGGSVYYLSHLNVVEGSEEISLVVRDENTGLILSRVRQVQNVDYVVKYEEGRVMFHRPLASVSGEGSVANQQILGGHRVFVHVDYETLLDDFDKTGSGARVRRQVGDHLSVGGTYVDDELGAGPYELMALDTEVRLGKNTRLVAEYAGSEGSDSRTFLSEDGGLTYSEAPAGTSLEGSAWKAAAELDLGEWFDRPDRFRLDLYYKELEPGFFSSGNLLEQGTEKMGLRAGAEITKSDKLELRHDIEQRDASAGPLAAAGDETTLSSLRWYHRKERWGLDVEYFDLDFESGAAAPPPDRSSALGAARYWNKLTDKLTARLEHQQTLSGLANDQTTAGVEYQVLPSLALSVDGTAGDLGQSARAGAILTRGPTQIYLSERLDESQAGDRTATIVGARAPLGRSSQVYSEYQWEDADAGDRTTSLVGMQKQWDVEPGLRVVVAGEVADSASDAGDGQRSALSAGVLWSPGADLKISSRQEIRFDDAAQRRRQFFTVNQLDYRVNVDLTLLARYRYSTTEDRDTDVVEARFNERTLGFAYRPVRYDRFNALFRYTRLDDLRSISASTSDLREIETDVVSAETIFDLTRRVEWWGKGAVRWQSERFGDLPAIESELALLISRLNFNVWKPLDLGVEYRVLSEDETDDRRQGWLGEVTWEVIEHFRVGAGYNFTDFSDDEFADQDYTVDGWFFRVQGRY